MNAEDLKKERLGLGYKTHKALAEALGVSIWTVHSWEQGRRPIPAWVPKFLEVIAIVKGIDDHGKSYLLH
jgi:DNA-binding transcriptional regulator YiaG